MNYALGAVLVAGALAVTLAILVELAYSPELKMRLVKPRMPLTNTSRG